MESDLKKAGIPKVTPEGKADFHACRVAYLTHLVESSADVKTVQELARHGADPEVAKALKAAEDRLAKEKPNPPPRRDVPQPAPAPEKPLSLP